MKSAKKKKEQKKLILRKRTLKLRERGKDPHKGGTPCVDTGSGGANGALVKINRGTHRDTGNNDETFNYFLEEQRRVLLIIQKGRTNSGLEGLARALFNWLLR